MGKNIVCVRPIRTHHFDPPIFIQNHSFKICFDVPNEILNTYEITLIQTGTNH